MIKNLLKLFSIENKTGRDDSVNPNLSTYLKLKKTHNYCFGTFIERYLNRIDVIDDFRMDGIACAQYIPQMRRLRIVINPLNLWDRVLRTVAMENIFYVDNVHIQEIDRVIVDAFINNGWSDDNFSIWIEFLLKYNIPFKSISYDCISMNPRFLSNVGIPLSSVLVHEVLHCVWNHCSSPRRQIDDKSEMFNMTLTNIAMDFSINQTLTFGIMDSNFMTRTNIKLLEAFVNGGAPTIQEYDDVDQHIFLDEFWNQPYEYYYNILKNCDEDILKNFLGESQLQSTLFDLDPQDIYELFKHKIGNLSEEELEEFRDGFKLDGKQDFVDFNQTPSEIKKVSSNDIKRIIDDMLRNGEINSPNEALDTLPFSPNQSFGKIIKDIYRTKCKPWDSILRHEIIKTIGYQDFDYTMKRESRVVSGMYPGKSRETGIDLILIEDVSGSINFEDWNRFKNEMIKATREIDSPKVRYIQFHSEISFDSMVPISKLRDIGISETGGTNMKVPLERLKSERNKTTAIVFTDGWVDDGFEQKDFPFKVIIFVSASGNFSVCKGLVDRGFTVISQDGGNEWYK